MLKRNLTKKQELVLDFIQKYYRKHGKSPSVEEIADFLDVTSKGTVMEHLGGLEKKGYIKRNPGAYRGIILTNSEDAEVEIPITDLPLVGEIAAGKPIEVFEEMETVKVAKSLVPKLNKNYFALRVNGDSMKEDGIYDGEIVIIESQDYASNGDLVAAKVEGENVTLKYFYKEKDRVRLEPRNKDYKPIFTNDCSIIGVLRGLTKDIYN